MTLQGDLLQMTLAISNGSHHCPHTRPRNTKQDVRRILDWPLDEAGSSTIRLRPSLSSNIALRCLREKLRLLIPYYIDDLGAALRRAWTTQVPQPKPLLALLDLSPSPEWLSGMTGAGGALMLYSVTHVEVMETKALSRATSKYHDDKEKCGEFYAE
ncbi:hypothetical protein Y699_07390 [Aspergillus fumigatus Z5]|nr:hypothetical protein Y699_07390 [Aspergillus fumigatus Z5]